MMELLTAILVMIIGLLLGFGSFKVLAPISLVIGACSLLIILAAALAAIDHPWFWNLLKEQVWPIMLATGYNIGLGLSMKFN